MRRPLAARGLGAAPEYLRPCYFPEGETDAEGERRGSNSPAVVPSPHEKLQLLPEAGRGFGWQWSVRGRDPKPGTNSSRA